VRRDIVRGAFGLPTFLHISLYPMPKKTLGFGATPQMNKEKYHFIARRKCQGNIIEEVEYKFVRREKSY